ncbi:MAG: anti-sigma factor antagonist [Defluviitaleaceae bacterium]|nr:anti-sigma factor antagonist [Defluviitaleaceae bacterium]
MSIGINVQTQGEIMFVTLTGELDQMTTDQVKLRLMTAMLAHGIKHIVFNLKGLAFMDSSGIGMMLGRYNQVKALGGKVFIIGMNPTISKVFHLSGLHQVMTVIDDEKQMMRVLEEAI